jgi:hypothetical protein
MGFKYSLKPTVLDTINMDKNDALFAVGNFEFNANPQAKPKLPKGDLRNVVREAFTKGKPVYIYAQSQHAWFTFDKTRNRFVHLRDKDGQRTIPTLSESPFLYSVKNVFDNGLQAMLDVFQAKVDEKRIDSLAKPDSFGEADLSIAANKSRALAQVKMQKDRDGQINRDCK